MLEKDLNISAYYRHNNGDLDPIIINGYNGKGMFWVTWVKDKFKNMIPEARIEIIKIKGKNERD